jgi:hypothetical protein
MCGPVHVTDFHVCDFSGVHISLFTFMSLLIRVELPTYSHSFQVSVPSIGTISDVKREIESVCVGNPRVPGQRLIWRGRFLGDDEKVLDIWKVCRPCQFSH